MAVSAVSLEARTGSARRLLPLSGVVFVALVVISFAGLGGDTPGAEDSPAAITAFYDSPQWRNIVAALFIAAAAPFLVIFGVSLASALWPADGGRRPLWQVGLVAGSAVAGAAWLVTAFIHFAVVDAANQDGMTAGAVQSLNVLDADSWIIFNSGMGVLMLAAAGALLVRRVHPVLAWIALVDGIALFIPYADFFGLIVSGLWVIAMSVTLARRGPVLASS
jgi:hypothetical protein